jgi:hypothetical protein
MSKELNRWQFVEGALLSIGFVSVMAASTDALASGRPRKLVRFTSGGHGGTGGFKLASRVQKCACVEKSDLMRDWSEKRFSFVVLCDEPIERIVDRVSGDDFIKRVEVSPQPLILSEHQQKLGEHNYFRLKTGVEKIDLKRFARSYPTIQGRKWIELPLRRLEGAQSVIPRPPIRERRSA